ncbi:hypothetical protein [Clostridium estertheticum]|uniref:Uncharacterized protein n=2 Tax=Clostridium estertheticum TaxID=238834 RepID=A0A1J0GCL0_9CLOT|nr:hypothetical protein [Clostridium estertheticum]APC38720.1 hypothetical protein A7L45_00850 [Clostridium estertheticum subsp. estertheticum]MBU3074672.1 hypothetical protein [Clostridium estertheticum]MBU3164616.1 hypothetical protein [Clostridium estertheticum]MBZ9615426.1 hypothetical protein [Clostridium estertheticum subsp. laramiense]MPQ29949.1 hypothetical protein [Clostridium estertheticum]
MENVQKPKVGAGIKTVSIIELVLMGFMAIGLITSLFITDKIKAISKAAGVPETPTSTIVISLVIALLVIISVILILMKKELGIYMYFIATVANIVYSIVTTGFKPAIILSLILPTLMGIFIWKKKEIFSTETKNIEV